MMLKKPIGITDVYKYHITIPFIAMHMISNAKCIDIRKAYKYPLTTIKMQGIELKFELIIPQHVMPIDRGCKAQHIGNFVPKQTKRPRQNSP